MGQTPLPTVNLKWAKHADIYTHESLEHCGISSLTGKPLSCVSKSSISDHSREAGPPTDFKIVTSANSNHDILIKGSLLIAQTKPWLNSNVQSFPLTLF
jgi:hypothetical protein